MLSEKSQPIEDFSQLKNRRAKGKKYFVLCGPDENRDEIFLAARIQHAWLNSQHHRIVFDNGKIFDTQTRTVSGKPAYIFAETPKLIRRKRREDGSRRILGGLASIQDGVVVDFADLVRGLAGESQRYASMLRKGWPMARVSRLAREDVVSGLESLSTPGIECLASLTEESTTPNTRNEPVPLSA